MPTKTKKRKTKSTPKKPRATTKKATGTRKPRKRTRTSNRRKARSSKKKLFLKFALILCLLGSLFIAGSYLYVDRKVTAFLKTGDNFSASMIYSSASEIPKRKSIPLDDAIQILGRHSFQEANRESLRPGEYSLAKDQLTIYTREFPSTSGNTYPSEKIQLAVSDQTIYAPKNDVRRAILQPQALAPVSNGSIDARKYSPLDRFPESIKQAVLVTEDERFYDHFGIDLYGIARAIVINIIKGGFKQGASTITQQLAKNTLFSHEKTLKRKYLEALAAISLEQNLSKNKILEKYLNEVYLGQSGSVAVHGIPAASKFFFNKTLEQLNIAEAALLAGLIKAPSYYSPHRHPKRAKERRNLILSKMYEKEIISKEQFQIARASDLTIQPKKFYQNRSPFFVQAIRSKLNQSFNLNSLSKSGLKVYTGLDMNLQHCAENSLAQGLSQLEKDYKRIRTGSLEAGLVAIEAYSGLVKAWVGGRDYTKNQFDHVYQAKRQVGSTIKPFVYLTALDRSLNDYRVATPITILSDKPVQIEQVNQDTWTPKNYDGNFRGAVTLRYALERSLNIPSVYVTQKVSPYKVAKTVQNFGVADNPLAVPSISLGTVESSLIDLTAAYAALANGGIWIKPRLYISVQDKFNQTISISDIEERRVANEDAVFVLTNILMGVMERGTARKVRAMGLKAKAAGKTGTTNDGRDAWFVGYTSDLAAGIWVGYDDNSALDLTGSRAALPIWTEFMKCARTSLKDSSFIAPRGITYELIDSATGLLYRDVCRGEPVREVFVKGTEPYRYCDQDNYEYPSHVTAKKPKKPKSKGILDLLFG